MHPVVANRSAALKTTGYNLTDTDPAQVEQDEILSGPKQSEAGHDQDQVDETSPVAAETEDNTPAMVAEDPDEREYDDDLEQDQDAAYAAHLAAPDEGNRVVSVGYLALTRPSEPPSPETRWRGWYQYFPWEDWRKKRPAMIEEVILPALRKFVKEAPSPAAAELRRNRLRLCFGEGGLAWDEERVLERYELLYEAGLVREAARDAGRAGAALPELGSAMLFDHRRILATAIARLRGKMKYRPVVFELMAPAFTLLELQRTVEALSGVRLHKQNFRRLVADQGLVEGTGKFSTPARGRPAELFRFRREVLRERPAPGVRLSSRR